MGSTGTVDLSEVRPSMFRIQQGVPMHTTTGERKRFVSDGPQDYVKAMRECIVVDTGEPHVSRPLSLVLRKQEFCTSIENMFKITVYLDMHYQHFGDASGTYGYYNLHGHL